MTHCSVAIVPFNKDLNRRNFKSRNEELNVWLREYAGQNQHKYRTATFLAVHQDSGAVLGYYTTVFGEISAGAEFDGLPISKYPKPAFLIAKLAVEENAENRGIGKILLSDALNRAIKASELAGLEIVIVDAIDSNASAFYGRFGFMRTEPSSNRMFMTLNQLKRAIIT